MAARLEQALEGASIGGEDRNRILAAHEEAGLHRAGLLPPDEDDPRWLHPGRNLVILLQDDGLQDARWLAFSAGLDQGRPGLMSDPVRALGEALEFPHLPGGLGGAAGPDEEDAWLEAALLLDPPGLATLLADALDHLRHLHLEEPGPERARTARRAGESLLPLATRHGGTLERRFRWWCSRVGRGLAAPTLFDSC
ncbi:MAG: hypothetical protein EA350_13210 [Gemmatimonadales bacterium]|nr:MAG: hypothetical protein EA350_13210 [Gemmatimonadales bacterium]